MTRLIGLLVACLIAGGCTGVLTVGEIAPGYEVRVASHEAPLGINMSTAWLVGPDGIPQMLMGANNDGLGYTVLDASGQVLSSHFFKPDPDQFTDTSTVAANGGSGGTAAAVAASSSKASSSSSSSSSESASDSKKSSKSKKVKKPKKAYPKSKKCYKDRKSNH